MLKGTENMTINDRLQVTELALELAERDRDAKSDKLNKLIELLKDRRLNLLGDAEYLKDWESQKMSRISTDKDRYFNGGMHRGFEKNAKWIEDTFKWLGIEL